MKTIRILFSIFGLLFSLVNTLCLSYAQNHRRGLSNYQQQNWLNDLQIYTEGLKRFITKSKVDIPAFVLQSSNLTTSLTEIKAGVKAMVPTDDILVARLEVAEYRLHSMFNCEAYWKYYENSGASCDLMLYQISEFMVICTLLQDPEGNPDPSVSNYAETLTKLTTHLNLLKQERETLRRVPFILRTKLEHDFTEAETMIDKFAQGRAD